LTKILVVDDEPALTRGLSRAISLRRPDYTVLTAHSGKAAIELLQEREVDLVVTDLRMAEMDGFELLAWLLSHRPSVLVFAMSGQCDDDVQARLGALGSIECFSKPLMVEALLGRIAESLTQSIRGRVNNVSLAAFLQLVELEQKTCTLEVRRGNELGKLYVRKGELVEARRGERSGEEAAYEVIAWLNVDLTIESSCNVAARTIWKPTHFVVMEAMRLLDEEVRLPPPETARNAAAERAALFGAQPSTREHLLLSSATVPARTLRPLHVPMGTLALLVVDLMTGVLVANVERAELDLSVLARAAHALLQKETATLALAVGSGETLQELVVVTSSQGELLRLVPKRDQFVLLLVDTTQTNLVMARHELERFMIEFEASAAG
jgi:DNA-binding response OmpR family regulator